MSSLLSRLVITSIAVVLVASPVFAGAHAEASVDNVAQQQNRLPQAQNLVLESAAADLPVWLENKVVADGVFSQSSFGADVAISGNTAFVTNSGEDVNGNGYQGAVYVYNKVNGAWVLSQMLVASDGADGDGFGTTVAVDGDTAVIGAYVATVNGSLLQGKAYVFARVDGQWKQTQELVAGDGGLFYLFGYSVAVNGDTILVGASGANAVQGVAYVFVKSNGTWQQVQKLTASDGQAGDAFGSTLAIEGSTAIVTANNAPGGDGDGVAYVFTKSNGSWEQTQKLEGSVAGGYFGSKVAMDGNTAFIGASGFYADSPVPGAVYVFNNSDGTWVQSQVLTASDGLPGDLFGSGVAIHGKTALIGASVFLGAPGAAYLFKKSAGVWTQVREFTVGDATTDDSYGAGVALSETDLLIGASGAPANGASKQGVAYFYSHSDLGLAVNAVDLVKDNATFVSKTVVTNQADSTSAPVVITVAVPAAASFLSATASQGDCSQDTGVVTCHLRQIEGNAGTATADVTLKATGGAGTVIRNTASVANAVPGLVAASNTTVNTPPVAQDAHVETQAGQPVEGQLGASGPEGLALTFSVVTPPAHGEVTLSDANKGLYTYTPDAGYAAGDSFTFKANDGYADSNVATVTISVVNEPPVASDGTLTTDRNVAAQGSLKATDPEGDTLDYKVVAPPAHGNVALDSATGEYTYTPSDDYFGADAFTFVANDGANDSNVATVSVTVQGSAPPSDNGGGGSFGGLLLVLLGGIALAVMLLRKHKGEQRVSRNGRWEEVLTKRGESKMRTRGKWTKTTAAGLLALMMIVGMSGVPTAPGYATAAAHDKPSGLTAQGIEVASESGLPGEMVSIALQTNLQLLSRATKLGPHASDATINLIVSLKLRNTAKLKSFLEQVQNPASPVYRQWLTPAEFTRLYGPSKTDVARMVDYLEASGITVTDVSSNRMLIHTRAPTNVYEVALGVRIDDYKLDGRSFFSTRDKPKVSRVIAPLVANILGLNNAVRMQTHLFQEPLAAAHDLRPLQAPPASLTNLNPLQIAKAYNYPDITDPGQGTGVNVAVLTAASSGFDKLSAPHDFWAAFGLPDHIVNAIPVGGDKGDVDGMGETLLDVEYAGAMGPGATLNVYLAADPSLATFVTMYNQFANATNPDGTAKNQVMTTSWGSPETNWDEIAQTANQIFAQAAAEGIAMFAAAGDNGASDNTVERNVADFPSSSPYITAANGTQLNVSDVSGTYGSEVVWNDQNCFGHGPLVTGGAISRLFDKPAWQTGPGVPSDIDKRMNADMAATGSCTKPLMVLHGGQWYLTAGTSAVAPQFAGMFAIAVYLHGSPLGQSSKLLYSVVNAGNYATDFHDVTQGCNGKLPDGSDSCAAEGWDHPSGWGSPNVQNLLSHIGIQGPKGTLEGTVTDAATGAPMADARIVVTTNDGSDYVTRTAADGTYSRLLPAGDFTVSARAFGYSKGTASISIRDGGTTSQDFSLSTAPHVTLSGQISDGAAHGYGLYASIKVSTEGFGQVANVWTDPATGQYSVELPKGATYELNVAAAVGGYDTASTTLKLSGDETRDFPLTLSLTCTAPGYRFTQGGFGEDFNGASFPPPGWTVAPAAGSVIWMSSSNQPKYNENYTGGTGDAAGVPAYVYILNEVQPKPFDAALMTPPLSATALSGVPIIGYKANYQYSKNDSLDVDISTDGGATWTNITRWETSEGPAFDAPGVAVRLNLKSYLPTSGKFRLRWRYHDPSTYGALYAQIDDVYAGSCVAIPGGLVTGEITDANSGEPVAGARVSDGEGHYAQTLANAADPGLQGTYLLFLPEGEHTLTASSGGYTDAASQITVEDDNILTKDFSLKSARFVTDTNAITLHVKVNSSATASFALKSTGLAAGQYHVLGINAAPPEATSATPLRRTPVADLALMKASVPWMRMQANARGTGFMVRAARESMPREAGAWQILANYSVIAMDNFGARDPDTGKVYVLGGATLSGTSASGAVYDPDTDTWSPIAEAPMARMSAAVGFINGKLYVAGGWDANGDPVQEVDIYDPATDSWNIGAPSPIAQGGGVAHAVLNGKLYLVGGCSNGACSSTLTTVQVYNPLADKWSVAADYPVAVTFAACAGIKDKLYCAGNIASTVEGGGYAYDPAGGSWSPIADMPTPQAAAIYAEANGRLMIAGGLDSSAAITNATLAYDPVTDSWDTSLPRMRRTVTRGAGVCGFYQIGGEIHVDLLGATATAISELLPGYDEQCGGFTAGIPWATIAPTTGTVEPGATARIKLDVDGSDQKAFTTSHVYLRVLSNTPYPDITIPLTVTWEPQPIDLSLTGEVSPTSLQKGDTVLYTLTVHNGDADGAGTASQVSLDYTLPAGARYQTGSGAAVCTAPATGSSSVPESGGTVTCDFGTITPGGAKTQTLVVKAVNAGELNGTFEVSAREPDSDSSDNQLTLTTQVIGTAELSLSGGTASVTKGKTGTLKFSLKNAGPDPASEVQVHAKADGGVVELRSASASQGECTLSGGAIACNLGQVNADKTVTVTVQFHGVSKGSGSVNVQASTLSKETDTGNNSVSTTVTVKSAPSDGGGGALGWLALAALLAIGSISLYSRKRRAVQ
jgi:hypothetical protein